MSGAQKPTPATAAKASKRGFVLLESVIAFAILALMLAVIYRTVGAGARGIERAEGVAQVLELLQSDLDRLVAGSPLQSGRERSTLGDGFEKRVTITRIDDIAATIDDPGASLFSIEIAAFHTEGQGSDRPILSLQAMRLQRNPVSP